MLYKYKLIKNTYGLLKTSDFVHIFEIQICICDAIHVHIRFALRIGLVIHVWVVRHIRILYTFVELYAHLICDTHHCYTHLGSITYLICHTDIMLYWVVKQIWCVRYIFVMHIGLVMHIFVIHVYLVMHIFVIQQRVCYADLCYTHLSC